MIIYTSGTTGRPKGAVHSHCGFPIKSAQDLVHCFDVQPDETMYWVSDMGWMMGPWEVAGMTLLGGTMVLYDGALDYPGPDRLWAIVERHRVNILGVSPTLIRSLMRHGEEPVHRHDLSSLRVLGSTGEPWNPESWWWFFREIGGGRLPHLVDQAGSPVRRRVPRVHRVERGVVLVHDVHRRLRDDLERMIRHDQRDLENAIGVGTKARHLEVDPDQAIRVLGHGAASVE